MRISEGSGRELAISGNLDIAVADELRTALRDFIAEAPELTVDLSAVSSCDAAALQLLCSAEKSAALANKQFTLAGVSSAILETGAALGVQLSRVSRP